MKQVEAAVDALNLFFQNSAKFCHTAQQMGRQITILCLTGNGKKLSRIQAEASPGINSCVVFNDFNLSLCLFDSYLKLVDLVDGVVEVVIVVVRRGSGGGRRRLVPCDSVTGGRAQC